MSIALSHVFADGVRAVLPSARLPSGFTLVVAPPRFVTHNRTMSPQDRAPERWKDGSTDERTALISEHQDAAYACAWRIVGDAQDAADVVQDAFVRALTHADRFDGRPFRPWLMSIVRNLAIDCLRRRHGHADIDDINPGAVPPPAADQDLRVQVATVLLLLPEGYRVPLIMRDMEGLGVDAIAAHFGINDNLMRWRLHEARRRFRAAWIARYGNEY